MESLEGVLMVPPDRGQILGRAVWKARYVVVARRGAREQQHLHPSSQSQRPQPGRSTSQNSSKFRGSIQAGEFAIAIYKNKDDCEPSYQYPVNTVSDCQVQLMSYRKQGPVLPTLVITISDKEKKRRSSRAAGLISTKESTATTLWFRTPPDDHHCSLHEWRQFILSRRLPTSPESPESPASPTFTNPFSSARSRDERILSAYRAANARERDRDASISHNSNESPSLRSKRSDVSSPTSTHYPSMPHRSLPPQNYTTMLPGDIPADLPSPAESGSEEPGEGVQARSASISSPRITVDRPDRRHASISASSIAMRETILDRAFQMRCIPGSERTVPGEEKLTSLARFDALMRESEERRQRRVAQEMADQEAQRQELNAWREDLTSEEEDSDEEGDDDSSDEDSDDGEYYYEQGPMRPRRQTLMPAATQRALEFVAGRPESPRTPRRATLEHEVDAFPMPPGNPIYRPQTSYALKRPHMSARTQSQPQLPQAPPRGPPPPLPSQVAEDDERAPQGTNPKRVSFTEYAKRGSSTSSLLLVQNGSGASSSRASAELEYHPVLPPLPRGSVRGGGRDERGGWRGSVSALGAEGNFI